MAFSEDEIRTILDGIEKLLRDQNNRIQIEHEVGMAGYGNSATGFMEYQPTSGRRISIVVNGGPDHSVQEMHPLYLGDTMVQCNCGRCAHNPHAIQNPIIRHKHNSNEWIVEEDSPRRG